MFDIRCSEICSLEGFGMKMEIKFCIVDFLKCINQFVIFLSAVFNALVLLCIKEIDGALQKLFNLKMDKDQKK